MNPITASTWIDAPPSEVFTLAVRTIERSDDVVSSISEEPPRSCSVEGESNGRKFKRTMMFEPDRGGTIVSVDVEFENASIVSRMMAPLSGAAGRARKELEEELKDLKTEAESAHSIQAKD